MSYPGQRPDYQDVLSRLRVWVSAQDAQFDIMEPRWRLADTTPGAYYTGGALSDLYASQVLRAVNALVRAGELIKTGERRDALYWPPEARRRELAKAEQASIKMAAEQERWRSAKMRLAGHHILVAGSGPLSIKLDLADWERLLDLLDGKLAETRQRHAK